MTERHERVADLVVVGSGFAGSILARVARVLGLRVVLLERGEHPRFAVGESSTPLGNLCLRRLASRYGLADLRDLASYGRWLACYPEVRRGLKRGFTFYGHRPGLPYRPGPDNAQRLLVAASPDDQVADTHWLRADVDAFLVERAMAEGVDYRPRTELIGVERGGSGWRLRCASGGSESWVEGRLLVDASGSAGALARLLPIASRLEAVGPRSSLVYGHFSGVGSFAAQVEAESGAALAPGPYPDERAAVHHLLEEGWLYALPFDHDCVSAGVVLLGEPQIGDDPAAAWRAVLRRYPSLAAQFSSAQARVGPFAVGRLQHRLARAAGEDWALLPHAFAFFDPIFSTGIAWSLLGVERLGRALEALREGQPVAPALARYGSLLDREADRIEALVAGAYRTVADPPLLFAFAQLYFVAVSYAEARQAIDRRAADEAAWNGFLGVGDEVLDRAFGDAGRLLAGAPAPGSEGSLPFRRRFERWLAEAVEERNVAGLADPARRNLYPVDLEVMVRRAPLLGRSPEEMRGLLPRLREV